MTSYPSTIPFETVAALCRELHVDPHFVKEIRLVAPERVEVIMYATDANGVKYLDSDERVALAGFTVRIEGEES